MNNLVQTLLYLVPVLLILAWYLRRHRQHESHGVEALKEATESGMTEPPTLHPEIDHALCIGCTNCVAACPEQHAHPVLGMINKKAHLVGPSNCIGHGACKTVCPENAITLVFGTATRGVDIPVVAPDFQTNVPGVFIAGELGGMGLIRNAVEQGRQAMESIRKVVSAQHRNDYDVLIVGAGPAGLAATLGAMQAGLKYATIEQEDLGGTVAHFPRRKLVMTQPAELPIVGKMAFKEVLKETLIEFWQEVEQKTGIAINYKERVDAIEPQVDGGFRVTTNRGSFDTRSILLAIGRRGSPPQPCVPGEDLAKVVYRLIDPEQYRGQNVLVVGGGDSALEAAHSIAEEPGTDVTLSYRSEAFTRAKPKNRDKVALLAEQGRLRALMTSNVKSIAENTVDIAVNDKLVRLPNDVVIVCVGGVLPTGFLKNIGVDVETKYGTA